MKRLRVVLLTVSTVLALGGCGLSDMSDTSASVIRQTQSLELQQRGKQLRAELDGSYREMQSYTTQGPGRDVREIVVKYIPPRHFF